MPLNAALALMLWWTHFLWAAGSSGLTLPLLEPELPLPYLIKCPSSSLLTECLWKNRATINLV